MNLVYNINNFSLNGENTFVMNIFKCDIQSNISFYLWTAALILNSECLFISKNLLLYSTYKYLSLHLKYLLYNKCCDYFPLSIKLHCFNEKCEDNEI